MPQKGRTEASRLSIESLRKRIDRVLPEHPPSVDGMRLLIVDTRIAMESIGENGSYPTIGMYGNWCVHPSLTHNTMYHDIISDVQLAYEQCKSEERGELKTLGLTPEAPDAKSAPVSGKAMDRLFQNIKNCFRTDELRSELSAFYSAHEIDTQIIDSDHNWQQFIFLLLLSLVDRPLEVPEGKKAYEIIKQRSEHKDWAPIRLSLERRTSKEHPNVVELWWVIGMIVPAKLTGRLFSATMA